MSELCFEEQPDRQRKRWRKRELAEHVYLVLSAPAFHAKPVTTHNQFVGILASMNEEPVTGATEQPRQNLFQQISPQCCSRKHYATTTPAVAAKAEWFMFGARETPEPVAPTPGISIRQAFLKTFHR